MSTITTSCGFSPGLVIHIVLKISGSKEKQSLFHSIIADYDTDWPWAHKEETSKCKVCNGHLYSQPRLTVKDLRALASQINEITYIPGHLKVKVKRYAKQELCMLKYERSTGSPV